MESQPTYRYVSDGQGGLMRVLTEQQPQPPQQPVYDRQPAANAYTAPRTERRGSFGRTVLVKTLALLATAGLIAGGYAAYENKDKLFGGSSAEYNQDPEDSNMQVPAEFDKSKAESVIAKGEWGFTPGIKPTKDGLEVTPTGMSILNLGEDDAGRPPKHGKYSPNRPLNLMSHIEMDKRGDVGFGIRATDIQDALTLTFAAGPDLRYDERTVHEKQVSVKVSKDTVTVSHIDERGAKAATSDPIPREEPGTTAEITVSQTGKETVIGIDGKLFQLPGSHTYFDKEVWLGADGAAKLTELNVYPLNGNKIEVTDPAAYLKGIKQSEKGLTGIAKAHNLGDRKISTAIDLTELMGNPAYAQFVIENFNQLEPAMAGKWQALQPKEGVYTFGELDAIVAFANKHGMDVHGHTLDFTEAYPQWLEKKLQDPATSRAEAKKLLEDHITTVVNHYDGKDGRPLISRWDVVNEPFDPEEYEELNSKNIWAEKLGEDHIKIAFAAARKANPDALLYLNEWGETDEDRRNAVYNLVKDLSQDKLIDGVAFQGHWFEEDLQDGDVLDELFNGTLENYLRKIAALKNHKGESLRIRISEASVATDGGEKVKARVYGQLARIAMNIPTGDFGVWGAANKDDYMTADGEGDLGDDAIARQEQFRTGPVETNAAYTAIARALAGK